MEASWSALGVFKERRPTWGIGRGEVRERSRTRRGQAAAQGGVGEGFTPLPLELKE